jgi:transcriptional regulator with XRE-family HTH domain
MSDERKHPSIGEMIDEVNSELGIEDEVQYWQPLTDFVHEIIRARYIDNVSQKELAERMKSRQTAISRFENMGRKPTYDFMARMVRSLGHQIGLTAFGEFMAVADEEDREDVIRMAVGSKKSTKDVVRELLKEGLRGRQNDNSMQSWLSRHSGNSFDYLEGSQATRNTAESTDDTNVVALNDVGYAANW